MTDQSPSPYSGLIERLEPLATVCATVDPVGPGWYTYADLSRWMEPCDARLVENLTANNVLILIAAIRDLEAENARLRERLSYSQNIVAQTQSDLCPADPEEMRRAFAAINKARALSGRTG